MKTSEVFLRIWTAFETSEILTACAWCGRVRLDDAWVSPPPAALAAIDARYAFSHSICGGCTEAYLPLAPATREAQLAAVSIDA